MAGPRDAPGLRALSHVFQSPPPAPPPRVGGGGRWPLEGQVCPCSTGSEYVPFLKLLGASPVSGVGEHQLPQPARSRATRQRQADSGWHGWGSGSPSPAGQKVPWFAVFPSPWRKWCPCHWFASGRQSALGETRPPRVPGRRHPCTRELEGGESRQWGFLGPRFVLCPSPTSAPLPAPRAPLVCPRPPLPGLLGGPAPRALPPWTHTPQRWRGVCWSK